MNSGTSTQETGQKGLQYEFYGEVESRERLRQLILYISGTCREQEKFSATILNKTLFFADFVAYKKFGKPLTGVPYMRLPFGPVPKPIEDVKREMEQRGEVKPYFREFFGHRQRRLFPFQSATLDAFSGAEIALLDYMIQYMSQMTASEASELSHDRAWKGLSNGELIPYNAAFISDEPVTALDMQYTEELMQEPNWSVL